MFKKKRNYSVLVCELCCDALEGGSQPLFQKEKQLWSNFYIEALDTFGFSNRSYCLEQCNTTRVDCFHYPMVIFEHSKILWIQFLKLIEDILYARPYAGC